MIINVNDVDKLKNNAEYNQFLRDNPSTGTLKVRTTSASSALPVSGVDIIVSKEIGENTIIFFEGKTDDSGMINNIKLPTPIKVSSDLEVPKFSTYKLEAKYSPDNFNKIYSISLCCSISVIQYINITPLVNMEERNGN